MPSSNPDYISGACAARNKVANALAELGVIVPSDGGVPTDEDFKSGVHSWKYGGRPLAGNLTIIFHWFQVNFRIDVPIMTLLAVLTRKIERHSLFSAAQDRGRYLYEFALAMNEDDKMVVLKMSGAYVEEIELEVCAS